MTHQEYPQHQPASAYPDLHLLDLALTPDLIFDPRWQNIYDPTSEPAFDWMHYRQPDDALSSGSSSDSQGS